MSTAPSHQKPPPPVALDLALLLRSLQQLDRKTNALLTAVNRSLQP